MLPGRCARCLEKGDVEETYRGIHGCDLSWLVSLRDKLVWPCLFGYCAAHPRGGDAGPDLSGTEDCVDVACAAQATFVATCTEPVWE